MKQNHFKFGEKIRENLQYKANARLIEAAPELLQIVKRILKEWEAPTEGVPRGELIARLTQYSIEARAVIEKVEGRSK